MRILCNQRIALFLGTLLLLGSLVSVVVFNGGVDKGQVQAQDGQSALLSGGQSPLLPLVPGARERSVAMTFVSTLERNHISRHTLDQSNSQEALRLYIRRLDPRKLFFYQSDIDEFREKYELHLVELLRQRDVRPAFEIYNRFLMRLRERVGMIQQILSEPIDFTIDEVYAFDRSRDFTLDDNVARARGLRTFPRTTEEAREQWRKRLKSELLVMRAEAITNEQRRERAIAEGREAPPDIDDDRDPVERLLRRHISIQRRMLYEVHIENAEILSDIRRRANDDVMELFLSSVASSLDPHSSYMSPTTEESFRTQMQKALQGIGATLSSEDGYTVVRALVRGGPADRSGELHPRDRIRGVGQGREGQIEDVMDFKISDVVQLIRGDAGTVVRLEVLPGGRGPARIIEIVREEVTLEDQAAQWEIFEAGIRADGTPYRIGFIDLPDFYLDMDAVRRREPDPRSATADVREILREFVAENVDAVVLDLRLNGGGSLQEAISVSGLFLGPGVVVQTQDSGSRSQPRGNSDIGTEWTGPLVVMTNKFSASASEIFAGAIKDHRRGLVVGDSNTLGKGTVQSVLSLNVIPGMGSFGSAKVTIQGFYRPSGITTQGIGVDADIILPSMSDAMENISEADLDNALALQRIAPANFTPRQLITPQLVAELQRRSSTRVSNNEEFARLQERIALAREARARRATPLNEERYMEEIRRFNADEWEREELEDMLLAREQRIRRDFHVEEVLAITVDYMKAATELGISFPRERTVQAQPRRTWFGLGF